MTIILLVGLPGSGKSTWLAEGKLPSISSDEIRRLLTDDATNQAVNSRVFATVRYLLRHRLRIGSKVTYIDATNLTRKERRYYFKIAREFDARVEAVYFDVPLAVCKQRNRQRHRIVPEAAMERLAARLEPPSKDEGFARITVVADQTRSTAPGASAHTGR